MNEKKKYSPRTIKVDDRTGVIPADVARWHALRVDYAGQADRAALPHVNLVRAQNFRLHVCVKTKQNKKKKKVLACVFGERKISPGVLLNFGVEREKKNFSE